MHRIHIDFRNAVQGKMADQIRIIDTKNEFTNDDIKEMVKTNPKALQEQIEKKLLGTNKGLKNDVRMLEEQCDQVQELEKNVHAILDLIRNIAILAKHQGEQVSFYKTKP